MSRPVVEVWQNMTAQQLAESMNKNIDDVFKVLSTIPHIEHQKGYDIQIDVNVAKVVVERCGFRFKLRALFNETLKENKDVFIRPPSDPALLVKRSPVVTIMGHVDHGKTTLLDSLRHTSVVSQEFGGITQHIGAFSVKISSGDTITFLDTPGHAAFSAMRARGANVTDIVVLVVAADDGVMKQTVESIRYANEAGVAIIVAINKTDKPEADVAATKRSLAQHGIHLEDFGGDVQAVPISALKGTNLDALQEAIVALAELLELKADPTGPVEAVVVESRTDPGRGKLSTALVKRGTLKKGACLVAGTAWAKVRALFNDKGRPVTEAPPSTPVEVVGWRELPSAGDEIIEVETEQRAKEVVAWRMERETDQRAVEDQRAIEEKGKTHHAEYTAQRKKRLEAGKRYSSVHPQQRRKEVITSHVGPELAIVIKGDVDGSVEAILDVLATYNSQQCRLHLLSYGVGMLSEQDVEMAAAFNGIVYCFNVQAGEKAATLAKERGVTIKMYNIIYRLVADLRDMLTERLLPLQVEEIVGEANVLAQFNVTDGKRKVAVAGCKCTKGVLQKKDRFRLVRNNETVLDGELSSLKHFKNEVDSIKTGVECGLSFEDQAEVPQPGDTVVCYQHKETKPKLDWSLEF